MTGREAAANEAARREAARHGLDPDEAVSFGPPTACGDADPVEREAAAWMLFDEGSRRSLGIR